MLITHTANTPAMKMVSLNTTSHHKSVKKNSTLWHHRTSPNERL